MSAITIQTLAAAQSAIADILLPGFFRFLQLVNREGSTAIASRLAGVAPPRRGRKLKHYFRYYSDANPGAKRASAFRRWVPSFPSMSIDTPSEQSRRLGQVPAACGRRCRGTDTSCRNQERGLGVPLPRMTELSGCGQQPRPVFRWWHRQY
jgi:hypothetical protein